MGEHDLRLHNRGPAYDEDWAGWLSHQAALLNARRFDELDMEHLVDEVESLGRSDFRAFMSAIEKVLLHMLKWDAQASHRSLSWVRSINAHRQSILAELRDSPSYKSRIGEAIERSYPTASAAAMRETGLAKINFPESCPYDWQTILEREHRLADD